MKKSEPTKIENGSWAEWRRLVLSELNRLDKDISELQKNQKRIEVQIASQTTKLAMIGTIGGAIVGAVCAIIAKSIAN
jgi:predicted phage-related endonuclease